MTTKKSEDMIHNIKIISAYFLTSAVLIWIYGNLLYLLVGLSLSPITSNKQALFYLSWIALFATIVLSIILGCKSSAYIVKKIFAKIDNQKVINISSLIFLLVTGIIIVGNVLLSQKIGSNILIAIISCLILTGLYYFFTGRYLKNSDSYARQPTKDRK